MQAFYNPKVMVAKTVKKIPAPKKRAIVAPAPQAIAKLQQASPSHLELQAIARARLQDAESLYVAAQYDGCVYLCGYAVECALKAVICKLLALSQYPDSGEIGKSFKTHKLEHLRILAGLSGEISAKNPTLFTNWSVLQNWDPEMRYRPIGQFDAIAAKAVLDSVRDTNDGVLTWLTQRW